MVIGSHNAWSYLPPKHWWLRPLAFTARCQNVDIKEQYEKYNVRCFDLRLLIDEDGNVDIAHGIMKYRIAIDELLDDLQWLNDKGDCYVRVLHEARRKSQYTEQAKNIFKFWCNQIESCFPNIRFWCGRNLYNWEIDYDFGEDPSCEEKYASVCKPRVIDDWWPWFFAKFHNNKIIKEGTDKDILLIDYVNIGR